MKAAKRSILRNKDLQAVLLGSLLTLVACIPVSSSAKQTVSAIPSSVPPTVISFPTPTEIALPALPVQSTVDSYDIPISFAGTSFTIPYGLATGAQSETIPAESIGMNVWPTHTLFTLQGYAMPGNMYQPKIYIFPIVDFAQMDPNAQQTIANLQNDLAAQRVALAEPIPFLPDQHAVQVFHAQEKFLPFGNGSGVRFITSFSQAHYPALGDNLLYTYQGLTSDGKYYASVFLPIQQPLLQSTPATENDADYAAYLNAVIEMLNQQEGEWANPFAPSLASLDTLVQSLMVVEP